MPGERGGRVSAAIQVTMLNSEFAGLNPGTRFFTADSFFVGIMYW